MSYLDNLPRPFFVLAPMDDVTDTVFRQIVAECATADLYFTEFVNVDGLQSPGRPKLIKRIKFAQSEHPLVAQLWGKHPENFRKTASELVEMGFDGIDLNMGCPEKSVVKNGCCSALIQNRDLALEIIKATREGIDGRVPLSVKTRIGFNETDLSWIELLLNQGIDMLTVHGRTRKEMSDVPAHWDVITQVVQLRDKISPKTFIVGNGDIWTRELGQQLAAQSGVDGVMIGRGIFKDPFVFALKSPWPSFTKQQRCELYAKHIQLFAKTWTSEDRHIAVLNKFCKTYINGFDGAGALREKLMNAHSFEQLLDILKKENAS